MSEWWSYGLSDFLMFAPETYWRLVARYNVAWWPGQAVAQLLALALPCLLFLRRAQAVRIALLVLAIAWAWVGGAFHAQRYAEIFLAAPWLAAASALQAVLLVVAAAVLRPTPQATPWTGIVLCAAAAGWPLLAPLTGHPWAEAEVFGFMPDPTALATVGGTLALAGGHLAWRIGLVLLPLLFLALGAATRPLLST